MSTSAELQRKLLDLQRELERVKAKETRGVLRRVKDALIFYKITARNLGYESLDEALEGEVETIPGLSEVSGQRRSPRVKFRSPDGQKTWSGAGRAPGWLLEHVAAGGKRSDLLVEPEPDEDGQQTLGLPEVKTEARSFRIEPPPPGFIYRSPTGRTWDGTGRIPHWLHGQRGSGRDPATLLVAVEKPAAAPARKRSRAAEAATT